MGMNRGGLALLPVPDLRIVLVAPLGMQCSQQIINGIPVDFVSTALAGWQHVTAATRQAHGPVIHWSQHEPKCLERSANQDVRQELADRLFDAYAFMNKSSCVANSTTPYQNRRQESKRLVAIWASIGRKDKMIGQLLKAHICAGITMFG